MAIINRYKGLPVAFGNVNLLKGFENNIGLISFSFYGNTNIRSLINSSASIKNADRRFTELDHKMAKRILKLGI